MPQYTYEKGVCDLIKRARGAAEKKAYASMREHT